jgi:hypothetical protein
MRGSEKMVSTKTIGDLICVVNREEYETLRAQLAAEKARSDDLSRMVAAMGTTMHDLIMLSAPGMETLLDLARDEVRRWLDAPDVAAERGRWVSVEAKEKMRETWLRRISDLNNEKLVAVVERDGSIARAEKAEAEAAFDRQWAMKMAKAMTATESAKNAAERSRDELGIQLAAQSERLRLAMAVVQAVRSLPPYRANMSDLAQVRGKIAALDAVPGDALATSTKVETYTVEQIRSAFARACLDETTPFFPRWPEIANAVVNVLATSTVSPNCPRPIDCGLEGPHAADECIGPAPDHAAALDRAHEASGVARYEAIANKRNPGPEGVE